MSGLEAIPPHGGPILIEGPATEFAVDAERILRTLPDWFGIEEYLQEYARDTARLPTFVARDDGSIIGFLSLARHFDASWELHCIAVAAGHRGQHVGSGLLRHAERWLLQHGARFLQVKTIAASKPDRAYEATRAFYQAVGFVALEVFPTLWRPEHPCLQMIKALG